MEILDPTHADDDYAYAEIQSLVPTSADKAEIDANPLFRAAELEIVALDSDVRDRAYANRSVVVHALVFCASAKILRGGGSIAGTTQGAGAVKSRSETIQNVTLRLDYDVGVNASTNLEGRIAFFLQQCIELLKSIGLGLQVDSDFYSTVLVSC